MTQGNASTTLQKPILSLLLETATKRDHTVMSGDMYLNQANDGLLNKAAERRPSFTESHDTLQKKARLEEYMEPLEKKSFTGTLQYRCSYPGCEKIYRKKNKLDEHIRSHTGERPYVCPVEDCGKAYMRSAHLAVHARSHDETTGKPHHCCYEGCSASFTTRQHLLRHQALHERPLQFICTWEGCNAAFPKRYQLRNHTCTHTNKRPYPCTYENCESSFVSLHKLQNHQSTVHNEEKRYFCGHEGCNAQFLKWSQLQYHNKHEHEIMCPICSKTFVKRNYLTQHIKYKHMGEEQVECHWVGCDKTFASRKSLRVHVKTVHQGIKQHRCEYEGCERAFSHQSLLKRHYLSKHEPKKSKVNLDKSMTGLSLLTGYKENATTKTRQFVCPLEGCGAAFWREYDLKRHLKSKTHELELEEQNLLVSSSCNFSENLDHTGNYFTDLVVPPDLYHLLHSLFSTTYSVAMTAQIQSSQQAVPQHKMLSTSPPTNKFKVGNQKCAKCNNILSGHFVRALGTTWHLECFVCIDCEEVVTSKFFPYPTESSNGRSFPLCERDYFRRLNLVCAQCGSALRGSYITALDRKYHIEHFTCSICPTVFGPDDSYYEHNDQVYCHYHYSIQFAVRCAGCKSAILKQFVEINRHSVDEHWHPECYMINKFWNVKLSLPYEENGDYFPDQQEWLLSPEQLKDAQINIEEKVYQIWTVLSAFEESAAACISDMLLHVSNGAYVEGVKMAGNFLTHVEVLFTAIDDLQAQYRDIEDAELNYNKDAKLLCRKIITFFSLLSHTQETGLRRLGVTQELLSLVTGLAHYLKNLIRIALTGALVQEKKYKRKTSIARFLSKLMELASRDRSDFFPKNAALQTEVTSDLCIHCKLPCEEQCLKFEDCRWHLGCFKCCVCRKPLSEEYGSAGLRQVDMSLYCSKCSLSRKDTISGIKMITQLEQYTYLLRIALQRLYILLNVNDDEQYEDPGSPISNSNAPGALRLDARSKSYSTGDNPYESINLGDIKRMKSTHTNRKLSNSNRFGKRSTLMEIPNPTSAAISAKNEHSLPNNDFERELTYSEEPESLDHTEFVSKALANMDSFGNSESLTLTDLTSSNQLSVPRNVERGRHSHTEYRKSMAKATAYLAELGALDHFMVKHIAVINIEPFVKDYFSLEDLLELIDDKKAATLWGKFVTGLRTGGSKKTPRPKVEGTFGVPLDYLVERNGTESSLGAGPCRIRIPVFVDDCVAALKQMDVSVEGIFRKNGNIRQLKELSDEIDRNPSKVNLATENPIQVAALLKKFLRDLPDPLLTSKLHKLFVTSQKLENFEHRKKVLHLTCCLLPKSNRDLMEVLFVFMKWVASYSHFDDNGGSKMDITNLATVLAPNVIYAKGRDPSREESMLAIEVVNMLLEHHDVFSAVPNEILPFLQDVGLGQGDMSLAAREVLKKCESLMKLRKSHSTNVVPVDKTYIHTGVASSVSSPQSPDYIPPLPSL